MRTYEFRTKINGVDISFQGKTLPIVKSTWLLKSLGVFALPLFGVMQKEMKGEQVETQALFSLFGSLAEKEIESLYRVLFWGMVQTSPANRELIRDGVSMDEVDNLFSGDLDAVIEVGKVVIKENYGSLGKFLDKMGGLGIQIPKTDS